jgi:hypothetical protein
MFRALRNLYKEFTSFGKPVRDWPHTNASHHYTQTRF